MMDSIHNTLVSFLSLDIRTLCGLQGGFLLSAELVTIKFSTRSPIDLISGTESFRRNMK